MDTDKTKPKKEKLYGVRDLLNAPCGVTFEYLGKSKFRKLPVLNNKVTKEQR